MEDVESEYSRKVRGTKGVYELHHELGRGTFGVVWKAKCSATGKLFALKEVTIGFTGIHDFFVKVKAMKSLKHPNILPIHDSWLTSDKTTGYIVTEYMAGGSLIQLMQTSTLNEREVRFYFRQIILALQPCHKNHIYHLDLKPHNVLLDENRKNLTVADFRLSIKAAGKLCRNCRGTVWYMAPEIYSKRSVAFDGGAADIFSCGVILHQMLSNATNWALFKETPGTAIRKQRILCRDVEYPASASAEACHLMHMMLNPTARDRMSPTDVLQHPWVTGRKVVSFRMSGRMQAATVMGVLITISKSVGLRHRDVGGRLDIKVTNKEFQLWQREGADICLRVLELADGVTAVEGFLLSGPSEVFKKVYMRCFNPEIKRILRFSVEWEQLSTSTLHIRSKGSSFQPTRLSSKHK